MANFEEPENVKDEKEDMKVESIINNLDDLDLRNTSLDAADDKPFVAESFEDLVKYQHQKSQLNIIFDLLGTPTKDEIRHCDSRTRAMLLTMDKKRGKV